MDTTMSLVPSTITDPHSQLRSLQQTLFDRNRQLTEAEDKIAKLEIELAQERVKVRSIERGAQQLRQILAPLHNALGAVFGEIEAMGIGPSDEESSPARSSAKDAAWEDWKKKLGGKPAEAIDVLRMHGELNAKQLRLHLHCGNDYIYNVISKLHTHGLINKNGGRISLKEL